MWTRIWLTLLLVIGGWAFYSPPAVYAECRVLTTAPTYTAGQLKDITCDIHGNPGTGGGPGSATASAPVLTEASAGYFSFDLAGNVRFTNGTLQAGEDIPNDLMKTSGGVVRTTAIMTNVLTNTASATVAIPTGTKVLTANIDGTGAQSVTVTIYGDITSTAEAINLLCTITLSATTRDVDACPPITVNYPFYHAVTASISGTDAAVDVAAHY